MTERAPLFQIRRGYRARWNDLAFSLENGSGDWTADRLASDLAWQEYC
jgi:hypothetical protein